MNEQSKETAAEWLKWAKDDLEAAQVVWESKRIATVVARLCHESAEKAVKSLLVLEEIEVPRGRNGHVTSTMIDQLRETFPALLTFLEDARWLSGRYMPGRYPNSEEIPVSPADARKALEIAGRLIEAVAKEHKQRGKS